MNEEYRLQSCDYCEKQTSCSNIYVALRVAESEIKNCKDPEVLKEFQRIQEELQKNGYAYPHSENRCQLSAKAGSPEAILFSLQKLLSRIRLLDRITLDGP